MTQYLPDVLLYMLRGLLVNWFPYVVVIITVILLVSDYPDVTLHA